MPDHPVPTYLLTAEVGHPVLPTILKLVEDQTIRSVCEFGGGANPVLPLADIRRLGLRYVVVDASADELAKAPPGYDTSVRDVASHSGDGDGDGERFDLVVSRFLAEHVEDPAAFHANVFRALRPGGFAAHFFPTLPAPPFLVNRLLMGRRSRRIVDLLQPGVRDAEGPIGKFPAYYRWCEGPTRRQYCRFASVGFEVFEFIVLVGHRYYERFPAGQRLADAISRRAIALRRPALSTYALVVLRRPPAR